MELNKLQRHILPAAEAGTEYIENKIDGVTCYVTIGETTDNRATEGKIIKAGTTATRRILSSGKPPYNKVEYRTPGTYTITFAVGVTSAKATVAAGGGDGMVAVRIMVSGGTGGRGNLIVGVKSVTSSTPYSVIVGSRRNRRCWWERSFW